MLGWLPYTSAAAALHWSVAPQICVADTTHSTCNMTITIEHHSNPPAAIPACVLINGKQRQCWARLPARVTLDVALEAAGRLTVSTPDGRELISKVLQIKARRDTHRPRVRSPWRLF